MHLLKANEESFRGSKNTPKANLDPKKCPRAEPEAWTLRVVVDRRRNRTGNVSSWLGGCTLEQLLSDRWREYRGGGGTGRARRWPRGRRRERGKRVS